MQHILHKTSAFVTSIFSWFPPLITRLTLGLLFLQTGWGKLHNLPKVTDFFTELSIPMPSFMAHLVATTEFSCGILLLIGLITRLAAIPLTITMIVAILTAKKEALQDLSDLFQAPEYLYIVLLFWLAITGAGALSLDKLFCHKSRKR